MCGINPDNARALLTSTQQLRTDWSSVITSHLGIAITVNIALWAYFLKSYVEVPLDTQCLLIVSGISSLLLGLWRFYTRYIDNHLAALYPELLQYEGILGVPAEKGTSLN